MSDKLLLLRLVNLEWKVQGLAAFVDSLQQQMARLQREADFNGEAIRKLNGRVHLGESFDSYYERIIANERRSIGGDCQDGEGDL